MSSNSPVQVLYRAVDVKIFVQERLLQLAAAIKRNRPGHNIRAYILNEYLTADRSCRTKIF